MPIVDLGEWAESHFSSLCAGAGVSRNKSVQDRTGWDYIVEFPAEPIPRLPADLQPLGPSARVQVKSKRHGRPVVRVKLSNALRFAKAEDPCFVVLFLENPDDQTVQIFARHFWTDLIASSLERGRAADGSTALNRQMLTIAFRPEDDHTDDLLAWMLAEISRVGGAYSLKKTAIAQTIGMEGDGIHGVISFEDIDWAQLVDHQLGLAADCPVANVVINQRRFGIDVPMIAMRPDWASMRPKPSSCKLRLRGADDAEVWLDGELLAPSFPDLPPEFLRYRVTADILDLVVDPNGGETRVARADVAPEDRLSLEDLAKRLAVLRMLSTGRVEIQVRLGGRIALGAFCSIDAGDQFVWAVRIGEVLEMLREVAGEDIPEGLTLSAVDLDAAWPALVDLNGLVAGTDLCLKATVANRSFGELGGRTLWSWGWADVGEWSFMAVVCRPITRISDRGHELEIVCGDPVLEDGLIARRDEPDRIAVLTEAHRRAVQFSGEGALELFDGDFRVMLKMLPSAPKPATPPSPVPNGSGLVEEARPTVK